MDRGTQWFPGSDPGSHRACKRRGWCKWVSHPGRLPGGGGGGGCRSAGSGPQHEAGAASSPLGAHLPCPLPWSWRPSLHTHTTLEEGELAEPCLAPPELWALPGVRISPPAWENPQLWGSLCPVGKESTLTHAHGHAHSHPDAHGGSQAHTPGHTQPGGWGAGGPTLQPVALGRGHFQ
uniref:Uncharacterized protein n=1 Tax=Myotis myotis TaxID=51298 RepID=A0A7J7UPQ3_MYOMY|nr:hypothetical protein mMyoMyo1_008568 [Myotis myotis]